MPDAPPPTPEDELAKKQADLKTKQDEIASLNGDVTSLQGDIKTLIAKIADVQQALAGYDKSQPSMQRELDDDENEISQKETVAEAVLKGQTAEIDKKVADFGATLAAGDTAVKKAWDSAQAAAADAKTADTAAQQAQAAYDAAKRGPKESEAALKDVASLLAQVAKAETQSDFVAMYFLVGEAKKTADPIIILLPDDYKKKLRDTQATAEAAKADATAKKAKADQLLTAYTAAKQGQAAKWASRRTDLLNVLKAAKPKAA